MYIYIYIYTYVLEYTYTYTYTKWVVASEAVLLRACMHTSILMPMSVCQNVCTCTHVCIKMIHSYIRLISYELMLAFKAVLLCACIYTYINISIYIYIYIRVHINIYI